MWAPNNGNAATVRNYIAFDQHQSAQNQRLPLKFELDRTYVHLVFVLAHVCFAHITIGTAAARFCRAADRQRSTGECGTRARTGTVPRRTGSFRPSCPSAWPRRARRVDLRTRCLRAVSATGPPRPLYWSPARRWTGPCRGRCRRHIVGPLRTWGCYSGITIRFYVITSKICTELKNQIIMIENHKAIIVPDYW